MSSSTGVWQKVLMYLGLWEEQHEYDERAVEDEQVIDLVEDERAAQPAHSSNVRPLRLAPEPPAGGREVVVVEVRSFDDCELIGGHARAGRPVLFDLAGTERGVARRVLDFVSGVTHALDGRMEKVASRAFVLTPAGSTLAGAERAKLEARGYRFADGA